MILGSLRDDSYQRRHISPGIVAVDSSFVDAKKGETVYYNGFKKRKGIKIHAAVISEGLPLGIIIGPGAEYDPYRFAETVGAINQDRI
ncbi:transposase [Methanosarcina sp. Z-7115]|uniref:Transposase n=1 Tax=Methanosarcina baikalica TaxID=3073890 RepID=A0ABU2D373_9EURY|nr:transposase [Methanosarcina sp. Z-7115]MDR7666435.1 transposase [Methanosarcina sp. Z-7115]